VCYPPKEEMRSFASQQKFTCKRGETQGKRMLLFLLAVLYLLGRAVAKSGIKSEERE
jgi:hypothetical protein